MKIRDRVYDEMEIIEPVLAEIIGSSALQRLKKIDQAGYRPLWVKPEAEVGECDNSRFAHSLGVCLLLKKYGAPLEEQIAGLIHDVSHSAFSHCIDYVLAAGSEKEQSHQDNIFDKFVRKTEIPEILAKYKFDLDYILDDRNFPLKEKDLPDLCADRIDYSLRTAVIFGEIGQQDRDYLLENLATENSDWIFRGFDSAKKYTELFRRLNTYYYSSLPSAVMFRTVGDYLRHALASGYISESDLYTTDEAVLDKIKPHHAQDARLKLLFDRMNKKVGYKNDPEVFCKSRAVDPLCRHNGSIKRVSEIDKSWSKFLKQELKPKRYFLKFEK